MLRVLVLPIGFLILVALLFASNFVDEALKSAAINSDPASLRIAEKWAFFSSWFFGLSFALFPASVGLWIYATSKAKMGSLLDRASQFADTRSLLLIAGFVPTAIMGGLLLADFLQAQVDLVILLLLMLASLGAYVVLFVQILRVHSFETSIQK